MKGFLLGSMTLLFFVLTGVLLVRSDAIPVVQMSGMRAPAAFHVVRSNAASSTHLDVYKRQLLCGRSGGRLQGQNRYSMPRPGPCIVVS